MPNQYKAFYNWRYKYFKTLIEAMLWANKIKAKTGKHININKIHEKN